MPLECPVTKRDVLHSDRMIKARLAKWEYTKNAKREDWGYLAYLHERRKKDNKPTIFDIRGHRKTVKDLQRFIRNQNISPEKFLAESIDNIRRKGDQIPDYIRAFTPDRDDLLFSPNESSLSDLRSPSPISTGSIRPISDEAYTPASADIEESLCYRDPIKAQRERFDYETPFNNYSTTVPLHPRTVAPERNMATPQIPIEHTCEGCYLYSCEETRLELEACSNQLLKPIPLKSRIGHNDMRSWTIISPRTLPASKDNMDVDEHSTCSRCDQPCNIHFPSLDLFEPQQQVQRNILNDTAVHTLHIPTSMRNEGSWVWVSYCFLACMSLKRGDEEVATNILNQAATKFEKLLIAQDPLLLTAAGLMITVLHMHDQSRIAARVLHSAKAVVDRLLPEADPVRITISYLALSADASGHLLRRANFSSARLEPVYQELKRRYSVRHPYTITAHYNYAWMLKYDGRQAEAEMHARQVHDESANYFGHLHMQTITSLSVIAGCLALQREREQECIDSYRTMIRNATQILGVIHPYTLEAQRRLADKLERVPGQADIALKMHRTILFGRATMLGRNHEFTLGQKTHYENMLRRLGRWDYVPGRPSSERREVEDLFTKDHEEAWELVPRGDAFDINDATDPNGNRGGIVPEDEWCRVAIKESLSRSRSGSPSSGNEYEAY